MIYYREVGTGEVYAYSEQDVEAGLVKPGLVAMTDEEIEAHLNPVAVWWTNGTELVQSVYGADGWHAASDEEIAHFLAGLVLTQAQDETARLRRMADAAVALLQDAVELGEATEAEAALLIEWKRYRVALSRLAAHESYPNDIDWPVLPA